MAVYEDITEETAEQLLDRAFIEDSYNRESLIPQLIQLKGPIPDDYVSQYLVTYQKVVDDANSDYDERINQIDVDIKDIRDYYEEKKEEYTPKQEQKDRDKLVEQAETYLNKRLLAADNYRNDLENYAGALLEEWKVSGSEGSLVDGYMATKPSNIAMYHQMVQREFEPAEPLPLLAYGVGLGLFGGLAAVLWRRRSREIARLEREEKRLEATSMYKQAIVKLDNLIELNEMQVIDWEAKIEFEEMSSVKKSHRRITILKNAIVKRNNIVTSLKAKKNSLQRARINHRRVHRLRRRRRRLRPLSH